jgi:hypothetical protein
MRALLVVTLLALPLHAVEPLSIQDNSFLLEEAYNQEPGVWQYIFTFVNDGDFQELAFTNEIPAGGQAHQLSYTLPFQRVNGDTDFGDAMINYRYQLVGDGNAKLAISPRASVVIPSGDGSDDWGWELNLPVSVAHTDRIVTHWNAGLGNDDQWFAGGSVIGAVRENFHLMLETRVDDSEVVVSPGVRWAWNLRNGFQVVPGVAVPIGEEETAVFLYLSLER